MKSFYYIVCLLSVFHLHAVKEKKLTTKLGRDYDLQLAHKQKAMELHKLAKVVASKPVKTNNFDQQKQEIKKPEILKPNKNKLLKNELSGELQHKSHCCSTCVAFVGVAALYMGSLMYCNSYADLLRYCNSSM